MSEQDAQGRPVSAGQIAKLRAGALKMANCMRSHGVPNFQTQWLEQGLAVEASR